jgi:hypothetical protein
MIKTFIERFQTALRGLGVGPVGSDLEAWVILVLEAMAGRERSYHTPRHVLDMARGEEPVEILGALFHDVVYLQVDGGMTPAIDALVDRHVIFDGKRFVMRPPEKGASGRPSHIVAGVFGAGKEGASLPAAGLNEILSALAAAEILGPVIGEGNVALVAASIEGTIPFRAPEGGKSCFDRLEERLRGVNTDMGLGLSEDGIVGAVRAAVRLGNRDVENFAADDVGSFLDNTWDLLPELNPALRNRELYTIRDYRGALHSIEAFLGSLDARSVFHVYRGEGESAYEEKTARAESNVGIAARYLRVKLVSVAVLEALAVMTGGDAPMALFMGSVPGQGGEGTRLEDHLARSLPGAEAEDLDPVILLLLDEGRCQPSSFDMKSSPLSAYLYTRMGEKRIMEAAGRARSMAGGTLSPRQFLDGLAPQLVAAVAEAASHEAVTRRDALLRIADSYRS